MQRTGQTFFPVAVDDCFGHSLHNFIFQQIPQMDNLLSSPIHFGAGQSKRFSHTHDRGRILSSGA